MTKDFTRGPVYKQLYLFSLPILLANFLQMLLPLISSLWVGNLLGSAAFAAVTIGTTVTTVMLAFVIGMNNATLTIFAQLKGRNDQREIESHLGAFVALLLVLSLVTAASGYIFAEPLLVLLNAPDSILGIATEFLRINFLGIIFLVGHNFVGTVLRAFGDSKTQLRFVVVATVMNAVLTPVLIAGLGLGVAGAAYATALAHAAAFLYSLAWVARRSGDRSFRLQVPRLSQARLILRLGIPSGVQMIVIYAGMTAILSIVNSFGEGVVAGFGAAQRLDSVILLPAVALGTAVNAMAAQNIGVREWDRVSRITRAGVSYNLGVMLAIAALLVAFAGPLVRVFIQDAESVAFGESYLRTIALFYPFIGLNFIFNGTVRGAGAMFQVLMLNFVSLWVLRVPLTYFATSYYGESGIALGMGVSFLISFLVSGAYYVWGGWRSEELFAPRERELLSA